MAEPVEQRAPLARLSAESPIRNVAPETASSGAYPVLFYTSAEGGLKQVIVNNQGEVGVDDARSVNRKAKGFVEISGPVEVIALNGQKITVVAQPKSAAHLHDETILLEFPSATAARRMTVPYDALLAGLTDGHHIAKYRVAGADQYRIVHCLIIPQTKETQVVERIAGAHVQTENETPNYILVLNPGRTAGGIDWAMGSTRDFLRFEQASLIELFNCLDKTDPQRAAIEEKIREYLKQQAMVGLEKEVSRVASPITSAPVLSALREALPKRVATQDLTVKQTELPLTDRQGEFRVGDQVIVIHDPKVKAEIEKARIGFQETVAGLFIDGTTYDTRIAEQEAAILESARRHEQEGTPTGEQLGFPAIDGYRYLTEGLRKIVDEYNAEIERVLQARFYDKIKEGVLTKFSRVASTEDMKARYQAIVRDSQGVTDNAKAELDAYTPGIFERLVGKKGKQSVLKQDYQAKLTKHSQVLGWFEDRRRQLEADDTDAAEFITGYAQDIREFFAPPDLPGRASRLAAYQAELHEINKKLPIINIHPIPEELKLLYNLQTRIAGKIIRETNPPPEIVRLRELKAAMEVVTKGMDQYVERVENEGDPDYFYPYTGALLRADLLSMDDRAAWNLMVVSTYIGKYLGLDSSYIPNLETYPPDSVEYRKLGVSFGTTHFRERETISSPYENYEGRTQASTAGYLVDCWLQNRPYPQDTDKSPRAVLRQQVLDRDSRWLFTYDHPQDVRELKMSRQAWLMEVMSEVAYMSGYELSPNDIAGNMRKLRGRNLVLPPLGMMLAKIPRKELPVFSLAVRAVIQNGGFTFGSMPVCTEMGVSEQMPGDIKNLYLERNSTLANFAQYLASQVQGLLPGINSQVLRDNINRFQSAGHPGKTPRGVWRQVRELFPELIPVGVA